MPRRGDRGQVRSTGALPAHRVGPGPGGNSAGSRECGGLWEKCPSAPERGDGGRIPGCPPQHLAHSGSNVCRVNGKNQWVPQDVPKCPVVGWRIGIWGASGGSGCCDSIPTCLLSRSRRGSPVTCARWRSLWWARSYRTTAPRWVSVGRGGGAGVPPHQHH